MQIPDFAGEGMVKKPNEAAVMGVKKSLCGGGGGGDGSLGGGDGGGDGGGGGDGSGGGGGNCGLTQQRLQPLPAVGSSIGLACYHGTRVTMLETFMLGCVARPR